MRTTPVVAAAVASALATLALAAPAAHAFCGFYVGGAGAEMFNNATQVVLMRHGTTTVLSMQNNYQGPPEAFAMVIPVPVVVKEDQVKTLPRELFTKIDTLGAPRLVEYWESDPCNPRYDDAVYALAGAVNTTSDSESEDGGDEDYHVKIEAQFSVAEYDIVVLSATDSTGLDRWLRDHDYTIPKKAEPLLRPYVASGTKFFVAKVDPKKVTFVNGMATLSPIRVSYDAPEFTLPIRLGLANSSGTQDLIVSILSPTTRYEAANYPNVTIPTNFIVRDAVRTRFAEFYAALFDHALDKVPHAVVTEYAWDASSCDPCPGPTLDGNDLATLGADVLAASYKDVNPYGFTLTRLHARYGTELGDDLVFRAVEPIEGGRGMPSAEGKISSEVTKVGYNNFQGRYVILHPWTGAIACESPQRGTWGGAPPDQQIANGGAPIAATNSAFAPRGQVQLAELVAADVPSIGVLASEGSPLPTPTRKPHTCGCSAEGGAAGAGLVLLATAIASRRRRRLRAQA
jgi:MYXO-CTERM domain-containing protein